MYVVLRTEGEAVLGCGAPEDDLGPFQEEDVPDAQEVVEGQRVRKQRDEPVRAEHGRQHALPLQVRAHSRHLQRSRSDLLTFSARGRECRIAAHTVQSADRVRGECDVCRSVCFK